MDVTTSRPADLFWFAIRWVIIFSNARSAYRSAISGHGMPEELIVIIILFVPLLVFLMLLVPGTTGHDRASVRNLFFTPLWPWTNPVDFFLLVGVCGMVAGGVREFMALHQGLGATSRAHEDITLGVLILLATWSAPALRARLGRRRAS